MFGEKEKKEPIKILTKEEVKTIFDESRVRSIVNEELITILSCNGYNSKINSYLSTMIDNLIVKREYNKKVEEEFDKKCKDIESKFEVGKKYLYLDNPVTITHIEKHTDCCGGIGGWYSKNTLTIHISWFNGSEYKSKELFEQNFKYLIPIKGCE